MGFSFALFFLSEIGKIKVKAVAVIRIVELPTFNIQLHRSGVCPEIPARGEPPVLLGKDSQVSFSMKPLKTMGISKTKMMPGFFFRNPHFKVTSWFSWGLTHVFLEGCSQRWKHSFLRGGGKTGAGEQRETRSPAFAAAGREDHFHFLEAGLRSCVLGQYLITQTSFQSPHLVGFPYSLISLKV